MTTAKCNREIYEKKKKKIQGNFQIERRSKTHPKRKKEQRTRQPRVISLKLRHAQALRSCGPFLKENAHAGDILYNECYMIALRQQLQST